MQNERLLKIMDPISKEGGHAFNLKLAKKCIKPIFTGGRNKLGFNVPKFLPNLCRGIIREVKSSPLDICILRIYTITQYSVHN